jgi:hypothetical protein
VETTRGVRGRLVSALDAAEEAMVHWRISCSAAHVHAGLAALQAVDDQLAGHDANAAAIESTAARAESHRLVAQQVGELLALPEDTWSLFAMDRGVDKRRRAVNEVASVLRKQSQAVADKLDMITKHQIDELVLAEHRGKTVALKPVRAA